MQTCYFELINPAVFVLKNVNCYSEYSLANSPLLYWYWDKNRVVGKTEPMLTVLFCFLQHLFYSFFPPMEFILNEERKQVSSSVSSLPRRKCYNVTPLSRFVHWPLDNYTALGPGIIWRRLGPVNASFQNYLLSRHLHDNDPW